MPKIITITGPESTGKSTLCQALATHFAEPQVEEFAREYLARIDRPYTEKDLWEIAKGQQALIDQQKSSAKEFLFVDTDVWTIYIWAEIKYGKSDPRILELAQRQTTDHYLLCGIDVPWEFDPMRENPHDRDELYDFYQRILQQEKLDFSELTGDHPSRMQQVIKLLADL